jgi:DNA polymerase elongation subunit (family B)
LIVRGIEARRHDAPNFIKDFQSELLYTMFDCKDSTEILSRGYENALLLVTRTIDKIMAGELELKDLIVSKILRQDLYKYRSLFPHVSAALQLTEAGVPLTRGDTIQYIYADAAHSNPLRRVTPVEFIDEGREQVYDERRSIARCYWRPQKLCLVILASTGRYLENLVAAKTENGGISSGSSGRET